MKITRRQLRRLIYEAVLLEGKTKSFTHKVGGEKFTVYYKMICSDKKPMAMTTDRLKDIFGGENAEVLLDSVHEVYQIQGTAPKKSEAEKKDETLIGPRYKAHLAELVAKVNPGQKRKIIIQEPGYVAVYKSKLDEESRRPRRRTGG
jgi:hypothetical protein